MASPRRLYAVVMVMVLGLAAALAAAAWPGSSVPHLGVSADAGPEIQIRDWHVLGPFEGAADQPPEDFLSAAGGEDRIDERSLAGPGGWAQGLWRRLSGGAAPRIRQEGAYIKFKDVLPVAPKPGLTVYLSCVLESSEPRRAALLVASSVGFRARLNDRWLISRAFKPSVREYDDLAILDLRKGANFLLVKLTALGHADKRMSFGASVFPSLDAGYRAFLSGEAPLVLENPLAARGEGLRFRAWLSGDLDADRAAILDWRRRTVLREGTLRELEGRDLDLPEGLYLYRATLSAERIEEPIFVGNPEAALDRYQARYAQRRDLGDRERIHIEALFSRYRHLLKPDHRQPENERWPRKILYLIRELDEIFTALESARDPFRQAPGLHVRGFRSRIDGQPQYYTVTAPDLVAREDRPLPLLVMISPAAAAHRPFLEDVFIANMGEKLKRDVANRWGFIVVRPSLRGNTFGTPMATANVLETIEAVASDYAVDRDRISLVGNCAGGTEALLLAARLPGVFASVAALHPWTTVRTMILPKGSDSPVHRHIGAWRDYHVPIQVAENLRNTPVYVVHEHEGAPDHPPVEEAVEFVRACQRAGFSPAFESFPNGRFFPEEPWHRAYRFVSDKSRAGSPARLTFRTRHLKQSDAGWLAVESTEKAMRPAQFDAWWNAPGRIEVTTRNVAAYEVRPHQLGRRPGQPLEIWTNGRRTFGGAVPRAPIRIVLQEPTSPLRKTPALEGPILHAFTEPFLLVRPTAGRAPARAAAQAAAEGLRQGWRDAYFVDCPVKDDRQVSAEDIATRNLVLVGDAQTNLILGRVLPHLPLSLDAEGVSVGGKRYPGRRQGVQLVYPNPLNPRRYVVVLASNDAAAMVVNERNLSLEGWYDYQVWRHGPPDREVVDVGYFDSDWRGTLSLLERGGAAGSRAR